jgi:hypothetical protein
MIVKALFNALDHPIGIIEHKIMAGAIVFNELQTIVAGNSAGTADVNHAIGSGGQYHGRRW